MAKDQTYDDLSAVRRPVETANGLPNAHYIDPAMWDEEKHAVLFASWAGLAVASEVPEPGDAKPIEFLGIPLLLIRGRDGVVRVFENICRHRGMILVSEPKKIEGAIRCPYHSWCYGTDGRLVSTPHVGGPGHNTHEAIVRENLGLNEVRSHIWFDTVFINIGGKADPFEVVHADLLKRWKEFDQPLVHGGADSTFTLEVKTNWKLAVENYCESYHLPWVHPGLNSYSRLEDHYNITELGLYSGQGSTLYRQIKGDDGAVFPDFGGLSSFWNEGAEYVAVYPNVLLGAQRDHCFAIVLQPNAIDSTSEHIHLYYSTKDTNDALRAKNSAQWKVVFQEDVFVVEGMQKGRHAPNFDGGRFSPAMDSPTHCFHEWVARKIEAHREGK
jgi:choline monooxygenase